MAAERAESALTPRSPRFSFIAFALLAIFAGLVVVTCGDSQSPTAPDPTSSSSSSTVGSTSSSTVGSTTSSSSSSTTVPTSTTSSSSTTSVNSTRICEDELGSLSSGTQTWRNVVLQDYCVSPTTGQQALFSHFSLTQASDVTIDMSSSEFDTILTLRLGRSTSGIRLDRDDDGGPDRNSRIVAGLIAGEYTIEQGSVNALPGPSAVFTRTIRVSSGSGTSTSSTTTVPRTTTTSSTTTVPRTTTTSSTTTSSTTTVPRTTTTTVEQYVRDVQFVVHYDDGPDCNRRTEMEYRFFRFSDSFLDDYPPVRLAPSRGERRDRYTIVESNGVGYYHRLSPRREGWVCIGGIRRRPGDGFGDVQPFGVGLDGLVHARLRRGSSETLRVACIRAELTDAAVSSPIEDDFFLSCNWREPALSR